MVFLLAVISVLLVLVIDFFLSVFYNDVIMLFVFICLVIVRGYCCYKLPDFRGSDFEKGLNLALKILFVLFICEVALLVFLFLGAVFISFLGITFS